MQGAVDVIKFGVNKVIEATELVVFFAEIVAGVVIHLLIEKLGTYTEQFYEWVVITTQ